MTVEAFVSGTLVVLLSSITPLMAQSSSSSPVDPALQKAISDRRQAREKQDVATWGRLTADEVMEIHSDGRMHTKAEEIAEIKAAKPAPGGTKNTDEKIRMHGASTAVISWQRNPAEGPRRVGQVWVKSANGQWQCVLTQQSVVSTQSATR